MLYALVELVGDITVNATNKKSDQPFAQRSPRAVDLHLSLILSGDRSEGPDREIDRVGRGAGFRKERRRKRSNRVGTSSGLLTRAQTVWHSEKSALGSRPKEIKKDLLSDNSGGLSSIASSGDSDRLATVL